LDCTRQAGHMTLLLLVTSVLATRVSCPRQNLRRKSLLA